MNTYRVISNLSMPAAILLALLGGVGMRLLWAVSPVLSLAVGGVAAGGALLLGYFGRSAGQDDEQIAALRDELDRARRTETQLQDKLRAQESMLVQLGDQIDVLTAPTIPIREGVVVIPLVGALQAEQIERIGKNLLHGIERHNAQAAILDLTGITTLSARAIPVLVRVLTAAELMGCRTILTGLSTETVRELLACKPDLPVQARLNLEAGIAYANRLLE